MKVSAIPAVLIMATVIFAAHAILNLLMDGDPKLLRSAVNGVVVGVVMVLVLKFFVKGTDETKRE